MKEVLDDLEREDAGQRAARVDDRAITGLGGQQVGQRVAQHVVELDDVLRDALADLLSSETRYGAVVDSGGALAGILSLEVIQHFLHAAPAASPTGADLLRE